MTAPTITRNNYTNTKVDDLFNAASAGDHPLGACFDAVGDDAIGD